MRTPAIPLLALLLAAGASAAVDEALDPGSRVFSTIFPSSEEEVFRVAGGAGSILRVDLRPLGRNGFLPSLRCVLSDGTPVEVAARPSGRVRARLPFPVEGEAVLSIGSATGIPGDYRLKTRLRPRPAGPRAAPLDFRSALDPALVRGTYGAFLGIAGAPVTGEVEFDGAGGLLTALSPYGPGAGSYSTDGLVATAVLEVPGDGPIAGEFTVSAGGDVLAAGFGEASPAILGLLLRHEVPTVPSLAGSWAWFDASGDASGGTLETGSLTLSATGAVSGLGVRTSFAPGPDGLPVPGDATPLFRSGTFTVDAEGTVTVTTRENLFGPTATWTFRAVLGQDVLAGGSGRQANVLLRQGTGLGSSDVSGDYIHLGVSAGAEAGLRFGVLSFDGAGGFSGTEGGGTFEGSYSVNSSGIFTLAPSGEAARTGIVGPEARYLLAFGFGDGGVALDLLIAAE